MRYGQRVAGDVLIGADQLIGCDADAARLLGVGYDELVGAAAMLPHLQPHAAAAPALHPNLVANLARVNPGLLRAVAQGMNVPHVQAPCEPLGDPMVVRHVEPDRKLRIPAGFSQSVAPTSSATIIITPQTLFRCEELIIPEAIGVDFQITGLTIGQISLITGGGAIPAQVFSEKSFRAAHLDWPTNQPTQQILLTVVNTNAAAKTCSGMFYGRAAF